MRERDRQTDREIGRERWGSLTCLVLTYYLIFTALFSGVVICCVCQTQPTIVYMYINRIAHRNTLLRDKAKFIR